ncbi:hypothetical protein VT03_11405 [Planctomyces sp. SH-PL14]|nr:hypothetical protein VT03_11405 [Planctomyces sp. SH-PL14]
MVVRKCSRQMDDPHPPGPGGPWWGVQRGLCCFLGPPLPAGGLAVERCLKEGVSKRGQRAGCPLTSSPARGANSGWARFSVRAFAKCVPKILRLSGLRVRGEAGSLPLARWSERGISFFLRDLYASVFPSSGRVLKHRETEDAEKTARGMTRSLAARRRGLIGRGSHRRGSAGASPSQGTGRARRLSSSCGKSCRRTGSR